MACSDQEKIKKLWAYTKANYVDKGFNGKFEDLIGRVAKDTGSLTKDEVADLLSRPKNVRQVTPQLWRRQHDRNKVLRDAKAYSAARGEGGAYKAIRMALYLPTFVKVMGHTTALLGTHGWRYVYQPKYWGSWLRGYGKSIRAMTKAGSQEIRNQILRHEAYADWAKPQKYQTFNGNIRSNGGLAIDPDVVYDDIQNYAHRIAGPLGRLTESSFLGLKYLRLEVAERIWQSIPEHLRTDNMRSLVQMSVNHSTGAVPELHIPEALRLAGFAPGLEASRWQSLVLDPIRTISAALPEKAVGQLASPEARYYARRRIQGAASIVGMLAVTGAIAKAIWGSDQNLTDPQKPGFGWIRIGDRMLSYTGGGASTARFAYRMIAPGRDASGRKVERSNIAMRYARSKLAPWASTAYDLLEGSDIMGKPLPGHQPAHGKQPYTVPEYLSEQMGPLSSSQAIKDLAQAGVPPDKKFVRALQAIVISASGGHIYTKGE